MTHPVVEGSRQVLASTLRKLHREEDALDVDWPALRTAHGTAAHVPRALLDLLGDDEGQRRAAYWQLDNHVVLQGDLYEAAPFTGLHLIAALRAGVPAEKRLLVYRVLYEICNGYAPDDERVTLDGEVVGLRAACRRVVGEDPWLFAEDVTSPDPALRKEALDMLVSLDDHDRDVRRILHGALETVLLDEHRDAALEADLRRALHELEQS